MRIKELLLFISLSPGPNTYYISIKSSLPEVLWTGPLTTELANHLKSSPRIVVHAIYANGARPTIYYMDDIIMREKE